MIYNSKAVLLWWFCRGFVSQRLGVIPKWRTFQVLFLMHLVSLFVHPLNQCLFFCGHCQDMLPLGPVLMDFDGLRGPL